MSDREKAMDERKRRMTQWYDHIADAYDQHRLPLSPRLAEALVRHAAVSEGERVLDVGTGTGNVAIAAARHTGARGRVVAIDLSRAMLGRARRKAGNLPIEFLEMDAEALPFGGATFDVALGGLLPDIECALKEMHRVLRPGGRAAFSSYTRETHQPLARLTASRLEREGVIRPSAPPKPEQPLTDSELFALLLEKAGFREIRVIPEPHTHWLQSAEDWWIYMRRSTRWGGALDQLSAEALDALKAGMLADAERLRTDVGIQIDASALIGIGVRR